VGWNTRTILYPPGTGGMDSCNYIMAKQRRLPMSRNCLWLNNHDLTMPGFYRIVAKKRA
jgi:hypothetical protein